MKKPTNNFTCCPYGKRSLCPATRRGSLEDHWTQIAPKPLKFDLCRSNFYSLPDQCGPMMALVVHLKTVAHLRGKGDRIAKVTFRGRIRCVCCSLCVVKLNHPVCSGRIWFTLDDVMGDDQRSRVRKKLGEPYRRRAVPMRLWPKDGNWTNIINIKGRKRVYNTI